MIQMSEEELEKKCFELHDIVLSLGLSEYFRFPNSKFVKFFLKDVDLDECYIRNRETNMCKDDYAPIVEHGGQVAFLDFNYFEIMTKDKCITLNMERLNTLNTLGYVDVIDMLQTTEEGLYRFKVCEHFDGNFYSEFCYYLSEDLSTHGRGFKIVSGAENWDSWGPRHYFLLQTGDLVEEEDIAKFANKLYRIGLPYLHEMANNDEVFEITAEDRIYYDSEEYEEEKPVTEMDSVIDKLSALEDMGFELSPSQKNLVDIYEKLYSEKFQQFKADRDLRKAKQQRIRQTVSAENERKEEWFNSSDNPSNKRIEGLKHMRRQIQVLESLREIAPELLSEYQNNLIDKGNVFFEMFERTKEEKHEVDTGMSSEIREWYQEYYTNDKNTSGKRI